MSLYVDIQKQMGDFTLKVQFDAGAEVLALLGPSGCGKSMTLKCIAGIEKPDRGTIVLDGVTLFDSRHKINLPPQVRKTGLLFQNYALFPNMTVLENILAGTHREANRSKATEMAVQAMESFGLKALASHYPHQLSGGQQQRAALARLLVSGPNALLLDEPFSALDSHLRDQMERELKDVLDNFGKTSLLVSHNKEEVYRLSKKLIIMKDGAIEAKGSTRQLFANPVTVTGARLTGYLNISALHFTAPGKALATDWGIPLALAGENAFVAIRSQSIGFGPGENTFTGELVQELENPFSYVLIVKPQNAPAGAALRLEVEKSLWQSRRAKHLTLHLPEKALVCLNG